MSEPAPQFFDLNIGEILESWQPRHAVRELIASQGVRRLVGGEVSERVL